MEPSPIKLGAGMGEIIHCQCGRAMECGRTDVLESVTCPACRTELFLDLESNGERRRGYLKVMAGPERAGEELLIPVDAALPVGSGADNWLYLPEGGVAERHCHLRLRPEGLLAVCQRGDESEQSERVVAQLKPNQVMRIGKYVLRFSIGGVLPPHPGAVASPAADPASTQPVPVMQSVAGRGGWLGELTRSRFRIARGVLYTTAGILAAHHALLVARQDHPIYSAVAVMVAILWCMVLAARRVGLGQRKWNLTAIAVLVVAAGLEAWLRQPLTTAGLLVLPAALVLTTERPPGYATTIVTMILLLISLGLMVGGMAALTSGIV